MKGSEGGTFLTFVCIVFVLFSGADLSIYPRRGPATFTMPSPVWMVMVVVGMATVLDAVAALEATHSAVTCGSAVKLRHTDSSTLLHSHDVSWGTGSRQQSVTTSLSEFRQEDDPNSLWVVRGSHGE